MMRTIMIVAFVLLFAPVNWASADDKIDFQQQILPIFTEHCLKCHGETKPKGRMSLHSAEGLRKKWEADEHLLVKGDPEKSELYERITLPADDRKRMPKKADPLSKEKIELIAAWIREGAVLANVATVAHVGDDADAQPHAAEPSPEEPALPEVAAAPAEAVDRLAAAGARVMQLYAGSSLLEVSFAGRGEPATDADVALLANVAEQLYTLDLADAQITPAGLAPLASLKNLASLHLERSSVANEGLSHLSGLERLGYLNLYGTAISDDGLEHVAKLKHLRKLYLWQTKVSYDTAMALEGKIPGLMVSLGFDHPVVAKKRLTQQLAAAKEQAKAAKAEADKAKQRFEQTKKYSEAISASVSKLEKQLSEIEAAADGS